MNTTVTQIELALSHVDDPDLHRDLMSLGMIQNIVIEGRKVSFDLVLTTPACPMKNKMKQDCINAIHEYVSPEMEVEVNISAKVMQLTEKADNLKEVKNVIAVASGKGGVGKSTVAANLAVALARSGAKVGLLDSDIYGPSVPVMFEVDGSGVQGYEKDGKQMMLPIEKYGIKLMSIGFFVEQGRAITWRGPMASNALKQMIQETEWGALDYLVVDLPPGTGDIQLSLAHLLSIDGAVMVSTPQQVAIEDVKRAVSMFRQEDIHIPILGFVENMAYFTPAELPDNKYYIFGKEGCRKLAEELHLPVLAQIPIVQSVSDSGDNGTPIALQENNPVADAFIKLAENIARGLAIKAAGKCQCH